MDDIKTKVVEDLEMVSTIRSWIAAKDKELENWLLAQLNDDEKKKKYEELRHNVSKFKKQANAQLDTVEKRIKENVSRLKTSVKGEELIAVFARGHQRWDTELLEKFENQYPFVRRAKLKAHPVVSIKTLKPKVQ
jgi:tRNA U34 5-carboxymethylaminomethyl modifying GTPase MnmE/TrmE